MPLNSKGPQELPRLITEAINVQPDDIFSMYLLWSLITDVKYPCILVNGRWNSEHASLLLNLIKKLGIAGKT